MKKSIFKRWYFWVIVVAVIIGLANMGGKPTAETAAPAVPIAEQTKAPKPTKAPEPVNKPGISKAEFDAIENGMMYEEVVKIIGGEGEVLSELGEKDTDLHTVMYMYEGEKGIGANANLTFQGGKLSMKAQFGLK